MPMPMSLIPMPRSRSARVRAALWLLLALPGGCGAPDGASPPSGVQPMGGQRFAGEAFLRRLPGLWSGAATGTPLGEFPLLNMDVRAVGERVLFARSDLDAQNNLRFAFGIETLEGADVLSFRNGGYFMGILRDTHARLVEHDDAAGSYRFCASPRGCEYLDARYQLTGSDSLSLNVTVRGAPHLRWNARRLETRPLAEPFPVDLASIGPGTQPFPELPSLQVKVRWSVPLATAADVWLLLSQRDCTAASCTISRSLLATPASGTEATLTVEQLHPDTYKALAFVDRNRNFRSLLRPDSGDGVSLPNQELVVGAQGQSTGALVILFDLP